MKSPLEIAFEILTALGVDTAVVTSLKSTDPAEHAKVKPQEVATEIISLQNQNFLDDETNLEEKKAAWRGETLTARAQEVARLFKDYGITMEDYSKQSKGKEFDGLMKLLKTKVDAAKASGTGDSAEEIQKLNDEIAALSTTIEEYENVKIPTLKKEAQTAVETVTTKHTVERLFNAIKKDTVIGRPQAFRLIESELTSKYDVKTDANGNVKLYIKGTTTLAKKNSKELLFEDACVEIGDTSELWKKSEPPKPAGSGGAGAGAAGADEGTKVFKTSGMKAAEAALARKKEEASQK